MKDAEVSFFLTDYRVEVEFFRHNYNSVGD